MTPLVLYRPTGLREMELVLEADRKGWPPRLPDQPIFYPVTVCRYAREIAEQWNRNDDFSGHVGFVTTFSVDRNYASRYPEQIVGTNQVHRELWVPAEELDEFNRHITGTIEVMEAYYGEKYGGPVPVSEALQRLSASRQLKVLITEGEDLARPEEALIYLNHRYWRQCRPRQLDMSTDEKAEALEQLDRWWKNWFPHRPPLAPDEK